MFKFNTFKMATTTFSDQAETFSTALLFKKMRKSACTCFYFCVLLSFS